MAKTQEQVSQEMDAAVEIAIAELKKMPKAVVMPIAEWFFKHFLKAGHKRLGRALVAYVKESNKNGGKNGKNNS